MPLNYRVFSGVFCEILPNPRSQATKKLLFFHKTYVMISLGRKRLPYHGRKPLAMP
jgi:hypothetical protein